MTIARDIERRLAHRSVLGAEHSRCNVEQRGGLDIKQCTVLYRAVIDVILCSVVMDAFVHSLRSPLRAGV